MSLPALFGDLPGSLAGHFDVDRPWEILGEGLDRVLTATPGSSVSSRLDPDARLVGEGIRIGRGVRIAPGAVIEGPIRIGDGVSIRSGAYLRAGCWLGEGALVGTSCELKRAILLPGAKVPHLSYVGDSILGSGVNLGAGTILSNFRHDGAEISIPVETERLATGRRKLGAILGDGVKTGCNAVLSPGVVVGRGTSIYAGVVLRAGVYPADSIVKLRQEQIVVARAT